MVDRVKIIILVIGVCLLACQAGNAQRTNPFDIIITSNPQAQEQSPITPPTDRLQSPISDLVSDTVNNPSDLDTSIITSNSPVTVPPINNDNPFNIKKTGDELKVDKREITEAISKSSTTPERDIIIEKDKTTNWLSKLKPKQDKNAGIDYSLNFIFWILIASLLILAVVINLKRKSFLNLYRAITNDNYLKLLQREEYNGSSFFFLLLYFLFFLNAALFLYQLLINKFDIKGYKTFLVLFAALLVIYFVRLVCTFILQQTFPLEKEAKQYNFTIIMFNIIVGLLLIPVNILTAYAPFGPQMIYVGLGIIALFYLLRQIRGLFIAARIKGLSYFHFFIYLCTFEVAPLFWIISFVKNWYSVS